MGREYAQSGVDYRNMQGFKNMMRKFGARTLDFPRRRDVVVTPQAHGVSWAYKGSHSHRWATTLEGLGNKDIIATWMDILAPDEERSWWQDIGFDTAMMAANDVISGGALPVVCLDEIAAGRDDWFSQNPLRNAALAESFYRACQEAGMALGAGESPAYRYLVNPWPDLPEHLPAELRLAGAPTMSCNIVGIIAPEHRLLPENQIRAGDVIIGARSSGLHANGISLVLKRSFELANGLLTDIGDGRIYGAEALIPTRCYVNLVEALLEAEVTLRALLPGTGDGVAKLAFEKAELTYEVTDWLPRDELPPLFRFLWNLGVSYRDMLTTFNMGIGYFIYTPEHAVGDILRIGAEAEHELMVVGRVERGPRQTIFHPKGYDEIILPPPGE